jgi:hypothetical protein
MNCFKKDDKNYVSIGEKSWNLVLSEIAFKEERTLIFPKKYFKTIVIGGEKSKIHVFDTFLMVSNGNSDFLISTEMSI